MTMTRDRRGFALLVAMWLVVAIAVAGLQLSLESRRARLAVINLSHSTQAQAAARAALDRTRARLDYSVQRLAQNGPVDQSLAISDAWMGADSMYSTTENYGDILVHVYITSIGSKLNINRASEREILNFFTAFQMDFSLAEELSQMIMDWRDTDDNYRARGAEREQYEQEGRLNLPRNNLFESVEELRYVFGMDDELFELISPYLTVWGSGRINLNTAEFPVLKSFSQMSDAAVSELLSLRSNGQRLTNVNTIQQLNGGQQLPQNRTAIQVDELEVEALATTADGIPIVRMVGIVRRGTTTSQLTNWRIE